MVRYPSSERCCRHPRPARGGRLCWRADVRERSPRRVRARASVGRAASEKRHTSPFPLCMCELGASYIGVPLYCNRMGALRAANGHRPRQTARPMVLEPSAFTMHIQPCSPAPRPTPLSTSDTGRSPGHSTWTTCCVRVSESMLDLRSASPAPAQLLLKLRHMWWHIAG